jgi:hypothetical protein
MTAADLKTKGMNVTWMNKGKPDMDRMQAVFDVFLEAVKAGGSHGATAGVLYAAVMDRCRLDQFQQIMRALIARKLIRKSGDRYFAVEGC